MDNTATETNLLQTIMGFIQANIAYILLGAAILYFVLFFYAIARARKTGEAFRFRFKYFISFLLILGVAVYCLVTGTDLTTFIH